MVNKSIVRVLSEVCKPLLGGDYETLDFFKVINDSGITCGAAMLLRYIFTASTESIMI